MNRRTRIKHPDPHPDQYHQLNCQWDYKLYHGFEEHIFLERRSKID